MKITLYIANIQANHFIEDIDSYLTSQEKIELDENYENRDFLEDNLSLYLKIATNDSTKNNKGWNYLKCQSDDKTRYYHISSMKWLNDGTIAISGEMDVVNSFQEVVSTESNFHHVKMQRCHKDRFYSSSKYRKFDEVDEGIQPDVFQCSTTLLKPANGNSYLIYKEDKADSSGVIVKTNSGIRKLWQPSVQTTEYISQYKRTIQIETETTGAYKVDGVQISGKSRILLVSPSGLTIRINRRSYQQYTVFANAVFINFNSGGTTPMTFKFFSIDGDYFVYQSKQDYPMLISSNIQTVEVYGTANWSCYSDLNSVADMINPATGDKFALSALVGVEAEVISSESIQVKVPPYIRQADDQIKQVTELYTHPQSGDLCYLGGLNGEVAIKNSSEYLTMAPYSVYIPDILADPDLTVQQPVLRNKKYETKLYGSYCRSYSFNYDNATFVFQPELWKHSYKEKLTDINSFIGADMSNSIAFHFSDLYESSPYSSYLIANRNNNVQIYSNDYLNYMRTGYNYDVKSRNISVAKDWIGFGVGLGNAASSGTFGFLSRKSKDNVNASLFLGQSAVNAGIGAVGNLANNILNAVSNNDALARRKQDAMNAAVNVSGSDNLPLFHAYNNGNYLRFTYSIPRTQTENATFDLFYYFGYADNGAYDVLPTIKTRKYFNYIQAKIGYIVPQAGLESRIADAILSAYAAGITFEWNLNGEYLNQGTLYENFETWI